MKSELDASIEEQSLAPAAAATQPKPTGGKALMRMLSYLDARGLHDLGDQQIERSSAEPKAVEAQRARCSPAPRHLAGTDGDAAADAKPSGRRRSAAARAPAAAPAGTAIRTAEQVGALYAAAVPHRPDGSDAPPEAPVATKAATRGAKARAAAPAVAPTSPPTAIGPQWRPLGPTTMPNGQTYGSSRVNVSGRVSCIAVHPTNPARVLCGAANGGVWESFDRGASWAPRTDFASTLAVGALAYDRTNPARVYCGLGEGNFWSWLGNGILRSLDGGTSWAPLVTAPFVGQGFYDLKVHPNDGQRLIAATTGGLYQSTNGGTTWTRRRTARTWSVAIAPGASASSEMLAACSDGLFRSVDGGTTWTAVALAGAPAGWARLAVSIAPSNTAVAYVFGTDGTTTKLMRRVGGTWSALPLPPGLSIGQAWYDWFLAAAPDRDNQVYVGAIDAYRADLSGTTWTWTAVTNKGASGDSIHPDQHAIEFEPGNPNQLYIGCDGGLYRSPNRGVNWTHCNNGLAITEFEYLAQDCGSVRTLLGGTQDNGTALYTGSSVWVHAADGDGGDCGINRSNPLTMFHSYFNMPLERSTTGGAFGSWTNVTPPVPAGEGSAFYPPFDCSASGGDTIAKAGDAVYVSRNNGSSWTRLTFPSAARGSAMYIPEVNTVYVGVSDGRIFRTRWSGSAWSALTALTTPRSGALVTDIKVDANNAQRLWATSSTLGGGRVFRSDNGGTSWIDCSGGGLPALPIAAVEVDTAGSNRVWVAADLGVYQSLDAGATWSNFSASLPNCMIGDLLFHPHARVLRAATRNRGVWEIPVDGWMTAPQVGMQFTGSLAAGQTQRWFTFNWPATWHMVWTVMPTTPFAGGAQLTWSVAVQRASPEFVTYWITVQNLSNAAASFEGRYAILSRY